MAQMTAPHPPSADQRPAGPPAPQHEEHPAEELSPWLAAAAVAVARLPLDDPRWPLIGPRLTAVVDAVRRGHGGDGSPIAAHEQVAPVLRLRDLARASQRLAVTTDALVTGTVLERVAADVRWLQAMTGRASRTP